MIVAEAALTVIAEAVIAHALDRSGVVDWLREKTGRDPVKQAFVRALRTAFAHLDQKYPRWIADLFDQDFFEHQGAHALKADVGLQSLHDSRAFERIAADVAGLRRAFEADQATPGTQRDYLHWLIEPHLYLDLRGTLQTQRQVQLHLDQVYVSLASTCTTGPHPPPPLPLRRERGRCGRCGSPCSYGARVPSGERSWG